MKLQRSSKLQPTLRNENADQSDKCHKWNITSVSTLMGKNVRLGSRWALLTKQEPIVKEIASLIEQVTQAAYPNERKNSRHRLTLMLLLLLLIEAVGMIQAFWPELTRVIHEVDSFSTTHCSHPLVRPIRFDRLFWGNRRRRNQYTLSFALTPSRQ